MCCLCMQKVFTDVEKYVNPDSYQNSINGLHFQHPKVILKAIISITGGTL